MSFLQVLNFGQLMQGNLSVCSLLYCVFCFVLLQKFKVLNGMFTDDLQLIQAPPYVTLNVCANVSVVSANGTDFEVTARSKYNGVTQIGHIRTDRYVWFSS